MPVIMFWNVGRKALAAEIAAACREHSVDVLILAECAMSTKQVLIDLNTVRNTYEEVSAPVPSRVRYFTRFPTNQLRPIYDDDKVSIRALQPPLGPEITIVAAHLLSKLHASPEDQHLGAATARNSILEAEASVGHKNTLVIGDLNMNPFDPGMMAANGFHGSMTKAIAERLIRTVQGNQYEFFYNPMWSRLGDDSHGPPGTYYSSGSGLVSSFWQTFDQVLLRPSLLPFYRSECLKVLDQIEEKKLLRRGRVDREYSDHLPIVIELETERAF